MHRFLLVVAQGAMRCPVNGTKSLLEVIRVTKEEVALMAMRGDVLVGTLGIVRPTWWYGDGDFLTDRWHFVLPQEWHGEADRLLMAEACKIADLSGLEFIDQGKIRPQKAGKKFLMLPRVHTPNQSNDCESRSA